MSYRYELHAHSSEVSPCGSVKAADLSALYKSRGYQGLVMTDHYHDEFFSSLGNIPWERKADRFLEGYRSARDIASALDFDVFLGFEIRFADSGNDFLVFGIDEDFIYRYPELYKHDLKRLHQTVKSHPDTLIIQAHPFRKGCSPRVDSGLLDGIEVYNGNPRHDSRNDLAAQLSGNHDLIEISGSDFHRIEDLGRGGIRLSKRIRTAKELIDALTTSNYESLICQESRYP